MKTMPFIFMFFFCALILISNAAIEQFEDGKQSGATGESKTKIEVYMDGGLGGGGHSGDPGRGHNDEDWEFQGGRMEQIENEGVWQGREFRGPEIEGRGGNRGGWRGGENEVQRGEARQGHKRGWEIGENARPRWGRHEHRGGENGGPRERPEEGRRGRIGGRERGENEGHILGGQEARGGKNRGSWECP